MLDAIPLSRPDISDADVQAVVDVLRSGRLALGPVTEQFEELVAQRSGCAQGVACSSGTAGLHMVLTALGIGPGDEVITSPFSFVASANVILYVGATPVFVDIDPISLNMDPAGVEKAITEKTKAIIGVEVFGNPKHMAQLRALADKHEIKLIEDSCEGLGGRWNSTPIGSFGHAGVFGFYPNKQITTGEGGMVVSNDDRLIARCRSLRNHGRPSEERVTSDSGSWLCHERLGFNYRMSEIHAALGVSQMRRLDQLIELRQQVAAWYISRLLDHEDIILPTVEPQTFMSWFVFVIRLSGEYSPGDRDLIIEGLHRHDVGAAAYFPCIHLQPYFCERFGYRSGMYPKAERASSRTIALPFYPRMTERDVDFVVQTLDLMLTRQDLRRT